MDPQSGDEVIKIIGVENIKKPSPKIVWDYSYNTLLFDEDGNPYKYGEVTAYLVDDNYTLVDKFSGRAPTYTFTPDGNGKHLFKGDEIVATMGEYEVVLEGGFFEAALRYALLTAVLEELIFRYLPMRLLAHRSPRAALLLSSLFFSLVHCDLFQMPYALFAGAVFMILDLAANSVIPSLVIHFLNNLHTVFYTSLQLAPIYSFH